MLDRASCERRVYRLAVMLTGNPIAATHVISAVVNSQPDLSQLDSAHMDRLTVLRSREIRPAALVHDEVEPRTAEAVSKLTPQQREAWVFGRVYRTPLREMSRAMDCSTTAAERHLLQADIVLRESTGHEPSIAAGQFLKCSLNLDVPEFYRAKQRLRRRIRRTLIWTAIALGTLLLAMLAVWWSRPFDNRPGPTSAASQPQATTQP
jgi:hypothetical protein